MTDEGNKYPQSPYKFNACDHSCDAIVYVFGVWESRFFKMVRVNEAGKYLESRHNLRNMTHWTKGNDDSENQEIWMYALFTRSDKYNVTDVKICSKCL